VLADPPLARAAVLATGFCAGLAPGMHPGDLVVAEEARDPRGTVSCVGTELLVKELARTLPGRTVHTGPLTGSGHVVRGAERSELCATGAIAVDMESVWLAAGARGRPVGVVRVVLDSPSHELLRIGAIAGALRAARALRRVAGALHDFAPAV
jgi:nucleoside phosphorylase